MRQAETAIDIHQQQVLDNLAKFVFDPYSMPSFAIASAGQSDLTDRAEGGLADLNFNPSGFANARLRLTGSRQNRQFWSLTAVNDPRKLELIRCAFQIAVANCGPGGPSGACPDCQKRFNRFYTGRTNRPSAYELKEVTDPGELPAPDQPKQFQITRSYEEGNFVEMPGQPRGGGQVTSNCLAPGCNSWFRFGCQSCVPNDGKCQHVGHYCGTYVWVEPGLATDELAKLTLAVLDFATRDPATLPTKEVVLYRRVGADGFEQPATLQTATKVVRIRVPADSLAEQALAFPKDHNLIIPRSTSGVESLMNLMRSAQGGQATFATPLPPIEGQPSAGPLSGDDLFRERIPIERFSPQ